MIAFGLALARLYEKFVLADGPLNGEQVLRDLVVELQNPSRKNPQVSDAQVPPTYYHPTHTMVIVSVVFLLLGG